MITFINLSPLAEVSTKPMQTGSPLVNGLGNWNKQGEKQSVTKLLPHNPRHACAATLQEEEG